LSETSPFYTHVTLPPHCTKIFSLRNVRNSHATFGLRYRH